MTRNSIIRQVGPPVELALVLVCEKCGRRAGGSGKNPSHQLASKIKRLAKREFDRGQVRAVLTSCMNLCPDDTIAVCIVSAKGNGASFLQADPRDTDEASRMLATELRRQAEH